MKIREKRGRDKNQVKKAMVGGLIAVFVMSLVVGLLPYDLVQPVSAASSKKAPILINNTAGGALSYYQVNINITYDADMNNDFSDLRVKNETAGTFVPYWIEDKVNGSWCKIWFNASHIPANSWCNDTYYLLYGNASASSASEGEAVFEFFDDFSNYKDIALIDEPTNPTRVADDPWEGDILCEQNDFYYNGEYISWYRAGPSGDRYNVGYETSSDGITWTPYSGNPILNQTETDGPFSFPYVVQYGDCFYMFVANGNPATDIYLYNVTNHTDPQIMNGGNPVYTNSSTSSDWDYGIFNPSVSIDDTGTWHMLLEGQSSDEIFRMGYTYSNLTELNWSAHRSTNYVIDTAGNPYLTYVPERNALLAIHGDISGSYWKIVTSYAYLSDDLTQSSSWHRGQGFEIAESGVHIADPNLVENFNSTYPMMISYNYAQKDTYQAYLNENKLQFFDIISSESKWTGDTGYVSVTGGILTLDGDGSWRKIFSKNSYTPNMALRCRANHSANDTASGPGVGFEKTPCCNGRSVIYDTGLTTRDDAETDERTTGLWSFGNWYIFDLLQVSGTSVKLYVDGVLKTTHTTHVGTIAENVNIASYQSKIDVDWVLVRKYADPEPTALLGAEQTAEEGGGAYEITLLTGWNIIGWTDTTPTNAEAMGTDIGSNCTYTATYFPANDTFMTHIMGYTSNNHAVEHGWGYYVYVTDEMIWNRTA